MSLVQDGGLEPPTEDFSLINWKKSICQNKIFTVINLTQTAIKLNMRVSITVLSLAIITCITYQVSEADLTPDLSQIKPFDQALYDKEEKEKRESLKSKHREAIKAQNENRNILSQAVQDQTNPNQDSAKGEINQDAKLGDTNKDIKCTQTKRTECQRMAFERTQPDEKYNNAPESRTRRRNRNRRNRRAERRRNKVKLITREVACADKMKPKGCTKLFTKLDKKNNKRITNMTACKDKKLQLLAKDCAKTCGCQMESLKVTVRIRGNVQDNSSLLSQLRLFATIKKGKCKNTAKSCPRSDSLRALVRCDRNSYKHKMKGCDESCFKCLPENYVCEDKNAARCARLHKKGFCDLPYKAAKLALCAQTCGACDKNTTGDFPMAKIARRSKSSKSKKSKYIF
uniref:ShKT domain-containing protein n=1 Tax=Ditylenchus dipsaci TaxID=166011 RepID=A0A915CSH7_9BILA